MTNTLITLADFHYALGFIGEDEYRERIDIALWLSDIFYENDPRVENNEEDTIKDISKNTESKYQTSTANGELKNNVIKNNKNDSLQLTLFDTWVFTKADQDPYPSIPHGHYKNPNTPWPKLNPYTGRVLKSKHQENKGLRLSKKDMQAIWNDENFKSFCREMIVWYQEQFPHYTFPVQSPFRFPRW